MKLLTIVWIIIVLLFVLWHVRWRQMSNVERPQATLISEKNNISIMQMPDHIVASVLVSWEDGDPSGRAFSQLAGYIFGDNTKVDKIAMTAPVTSKQIMNDKIAMTAPVTSKAIEDWLYEVSFIMPSERTMETLPLPNNSNIILKEVVGKRYAVWIFDGYARWDRVNDQRILFEKALQVSDMKRSGPFTLAQYNDPWTPPWMRRNELWVEIDI